MNKDIISELLFILYFLLFGTMIYVIASSLYNLKEINKEEAITIVDYLGNAKKCTERGGEYYLRTVPDSTSYMNYEKCTITEEIDYKTNN